MNRLTVDEVCRAVAGHCRLDLGRRGDTAFGLDDEVMTLHLLRVGAVRRVGDSVGLVDEVLVRRRGEGRSFELDGDALFDLIRADPDEILGAGQLGAPFLRLRDFDFVVDVLITGLTAAHVLGLDIMVIKIF